MENFAKVSLLFMLISSSCAAPEPAHVQEIPFPDGDQTSLPYLFSGTEGLMMSWVKMVDDSTTQLNYSSLVDGEWVQPRTIVHGNDWFINWADFPSITENNGNVLTHFLQKSSGGKFSYDVKLNILPKGASQWQVGLPLHTDSTLSEHGFVSAVPDQDDSFFVAWLDGRNTGAAMGHDHAGHSGAMSIRAATVGADGTISEEVLLDGKTCDCCQTTAAITDNGPIVVYRDRSDTEVRDIAITRLVKGKWTTPQIIHPDNWEINGCPVNGPKVDASGNDVVVAWFTGVNNEPTVQVSFSSDGGESFGQPVRVSGLDGLGRVDVELLESNSALVSWMETENGKTYLKASKVENSGEKHTPLVIAELDPARKSGFPQMEKLGSDLYFAWTEIQGDTTRIKTAFVSLKAL